MKPSLDPTIDPSVRARREFLGWMMAVPLVSTAACAAQTTDDHDLGSDEPPPEPADTTESAQTTCKATTRDAEGPYFTKGSPVRATKIAALTEPGVPLRVEGRLFGPDCKTPLVGYALDIWQADASGTYYVAGQTAYRLRGKVVTDANGRYRFETVLPGRYGDAAGIRPAHLHAKVLTPMGGSLLTTQLYFAGDPYLGQADYCTAQGTCNSSDPARILALGDGQVSGRAGKLASFDAILART